MVETRRTTFRVQSSHYMTGSCEPASRRVRAEPGRQPTVYLSSNRQRERLKWLEEESVRACSAEALPGLCGPLPGQLMANRSRRRSETPNPSAATVAVDPLDFWPAAGRGGGGGQRRRPTRLQFPGGGMLPAGRGDG